MQNLPTPEGLARLSGQRSHDSALLKASTELFVQDLSHDRDEVRRFEDLAAHLIPRVTQADRAFAAEKLAMRLDAPLSVIRMLARDTLEVAEPVLRRSPILGSLDLLSVIAATGPDHHRLIAERPALPKDVERALRLTGDAAVKTALDARLAAESPTENRDAPLAELAPAPSPSSPRPNASAARANGNDAWHFLALDRKARLRQMAEIASRPPVQPSAGPANPVDRAFRSILGAAQLVGHARTRNRQAIVSDISEGLGLASELIVACLDDPTGEPLAVLLKALALDGVQAQQVMLLASPVGRDPKAFFLLCDVFAGMEPTVAETLVETWVSGPAAAKPRHQPVFADTRDRVRTDVEIGRDKQLPAQRRAGERD